MRTRWLAKAEADHGGHDTAAESSAREPGAGAAAAKAVTPADRDATAEPGRAKTLPGRVAPDAVSDGACGV
jgi:hypothetical protein